MVHTTARLAQTGRRKRTFFKGRSISNLLTFLVLSILVPLLAFSALVLWRVTEVEQSRAEQALAIGADTLTQDIDRELRGITATLSGLSTSPALLNRDYGTFYAQADNVARMLGTPILVRDLATGQQLLNTRVSFGLPLPVNPPGDLDRAISTTRAPYVSDLLFGSVAQHWLFAVGVPVIVDGQVTAVLLASVAPERLISIMKEQSPSAKWTYAVSDRKGTLVARSAGHEKYLGKASPNAALMVAEAGVHRVVNLDGVTVVRGFRRTKDGWTVAAFTPVNAIDMPVRQSWLTFAVAGALALAFALPVTLYFAKRIAGSIRQVATNAATLERGDAVPLVNSDVIEVDEVAAMVHQASVTLRQRTRSLAESAARFRSAFDQAAVGFEQTDLSGRWIILNNRFCEMIGYTTDECANLKPADVTHPDDYFAEGPSREAILRGDIASFTIEKRFFKKDGAILRARSTCSLVSDLDGKPLYFVAVVEDITADYRARVATARLAALVEASNDAIISVTKDGVIETWNPGAERLFGFTRSDIVGNDVALLAPDDHRMDVAELIERGQKGEAFRNETVLRRKDGTLVDVAIGVSPILGKGDTVTALSVTMEDIQDRRTWENQLILLNRELQHRVKNSLAVVQSIANQTLRCSPSPVAFHTAFLGRLQSLAAANDLLLQTSWTGGDLGSIIDRQIKPLLSAPTHQLRTNGPAVALPVELTVPLGLALHELATNALKYGSLSVAGGFIALSWSVHDAGEKRMLRLVWSESGGPPAHDPTEKGFGSTLINRGVPGATVAQSFTAAGLVCIMELPLPELANVTVASAAS
ncbi:MAG: PAS domain S-box protein [Hyphomicrobiaceae bacterium]